MIKIQETPRLYFREILPSDAGNIFELDSNPEVHRYLGNTPVTSVEECRKVIEMIRNQYKENGIGRWAVMEKENNVFIGWAGLKLLKEPINNYVNVYDLGYRFNPKYWGKGYATEAAMCWRDLAFKEMNIEKLYACADAANIASRRVLEKIGMNYVEDFDYEGDASVWYEMENSIV